MSVADDGDVAAMAAVATTQSSVANAKAKVRMRVSGVRATLFDTLAVRTVAAGEKLSVAGAAATGACG
jgi:hypothetical protein